MKQFLFIFTATLVFACTKEPQLKSPSIEGSYLCTDTFYSSTLNQTDSPWHYVDTAYLISRTIDVAKQADGSYNYKGATEHDLALMRSSCSPKVQVKAAGGVRDLDGLIKVRDLGGSRCGATATAAMMDEYRKREAAGTLESAGGKIGSGGY